MGRSRVIIHDLGEYDEVWEIKELEKLLAPGWELWRIHRAKDQDTWRACKDGHRNQEARHFQTVMCKTHMIDRQFIDQRGQVV